LFCFYANFEQQISIKMGNQYSNLIKVKNQEQWVPKEELLYQKSDKQSFTIGVPKERILQEKRVSLVPSAAGLLVNNGHRVIVERGAGQEANFEDRLYAEVGAELVDSPSEIFQAQIIIKIAPPTLDEISLMRDRAILFSALHQRAQSKEYYKSLINKRITAISYEYIRNGNQEHPVLHSISEIVGTTAIHIASQYLSHPVWGRGKMLGGFTGINPSEVVIIGAGIVGESAAKTALGAGALVKVFDNSISNLRRLQSNLRAPIFSSIIQPDVLKQALSTADVAIGALWITGPNAMTIVSEEMVKCMKKGSIIVDVSIDRGGCFETSTETNHLEPVYQIHGVTHYCVPNISSRTPHTASYALSNYFAPLMLEMAENGGLNQMLLNNLGLREGVYIYSGKVTFHSIAEKFGLPFQDLGLVISAFG
jgi:alanine dehydrogenase